MLISLWWEHIQPVLGTAHGCIHLFFCEVSFLVSSHAVRVPLLVREARRKCREKLHVEGKDRSSCGHYVS